jgi:hypothetical protein
MHPRHPSLHSATAVTATLPHWSLSSHDTIKLINLSSCEHPPHHCLVTSENTLFTSYTTPLVCALMLHAVMCYLPLYRLRVGQSSPTQCS